MREKLSPTSTEHPLAGEKILDHWAILNTATPLDRMKGLEDDELANAVVDYDSKIDDLFKGNNPRHYHENALEPMDMFVALSKDIVERPDDQKKTPAINSPGEDFAFATFGSLIVANINNPAEFIVKMQEKFSSQHQDAPASQEAKDIFLSQTRELAHILYGERYEEYEQQLDDLKAGSLESKLDPLDEQNREIDKEIISGSKGARAKIENVARTVANTSQMFFRATRNFAARPTQLLHWTRKSASNLRLAAMEKKLAKKRAMVRDDPNLRTIDKMINNHRRTKADNIAQDIRAYRQETVDPRRAKYNAHVDKIKGRTRRGLEQNVARDKAFIERRQAAEARKLLRKHLNAEKIGRVEKENALAHLSPDTLQRIGRARCLELAAENAMSAANKKLQKNERKEDRLADRITELSTDSRAAMKQSQDLGIVADTVEKVDMPAAATALTQAGEALKKIDEDHKRDPSDPEYIDNTVYWEKYAEAKNHIDEIAGKQAFLRGKLLMTRALQEEQRQRAIRLRAESIQTHRKIEEQRRKTNETKTNADAEQATHTARSEALKRVVDRSF